MTEVAVVGFAHAPHVRRTEGTTNGVEMLMPCFAELYADLGIEQTDIGFWCSGSSDYLAGRAFSFLSAIDSIGRVAVTESLPPSWTANAGSSAKRSVVSSRPEVSLPPMDTGA